MAEVNTYLEFNEQGLEDLCRAVVIAAIKEYYELKELERKPFPEANHRPYVKINRDRKIRNELNNIETFFKEGWFQYAFRLDGEEFFGFMQESFTNGKYKTFFPGYRETVVILND